MAEKEVRKTTAKKAVRRTTTKVAPRKTAVRKTAAPVVRKAPVREFAVTTVRASRSSKKPLIALIIFILVFGISFAIGYSDRGAIDVSRVIAERKQQGTQEEQDRLRTVPVQQTQASAPNGGLVGTGKSESEPIPPPLPASTTASTTEAVASSTESSADTEVSDTPTESSDTATSSESVQ